MKKKKTPGERVEMWEENKALFQFLRGEARQRNWIPKAVVGDAVGCSRLLPTVTLKAVVLLAIAEVGMQVKYFTWYCAWTCEYAGIGNHLALLALAPKKYKNLWLSSEAADHHIYFYHGPSFLQLGIWECGPLQSPN